MAIIRAAAASALLLLFAFDAAAEVVRIDVVRRDDFGTHERIIGRVHFAIDPSAKANRGIADVALAPRNAAGRVEFSSDLLFFMPKREDAARGTVFLEVVNRGRDQSLGLMSDARQRDLAPERWDMGDRFALTQGFAVAFLGWQFDVRPAQGLTFEAPVAPVRGVVRASYVEDGAGPRYSGFGVQYCARDPAQADAMLTFRTAIDGPAETLPRSAWQFAQGGCAVQLSGGFKPGLWEAVYEAEGSPVAGLGLAAIRDFASYLKFGVDGVATLRERPALVRRVLGFGYSQSARLLREFVRDGFNQDERGRAAFDGLMIASAGAGGGSFNHRFAMPGQAGNSVLSILRPVDLPPFTDAGLLARARTDGVVPRIFYTFSSTEYWARAGSLTHTTTDDGKADLPPDPSSRLYFLAGTPHASGPLPPLRDTGSQRFRHDLNFAEQRWVLRALLVDLDDWVRKGTEPPASRYPTIARGELVPRTGVVFPQVATMPFAEYLPPVWRMDFGSGYADTRVITREPPALGAPYPVLVPQVNADGNDLGGVRLPEVAAPLGTHTGWNVTIPPLAGLRYLAGLVGAFVPFAPTREARLAAGDARPSIAERYASRQAYLAAVDRAARTLVQQRLLLDDDLGHVRERAAAVWTAVVER